MDSASIVGLSIGIVRNGEVLLTKGYGERELGSGHLFTADIISPISSISKLFTATAIMQLVEQGRIRIEDRVVVHLPEFTLRDRRYDRITIAQLLTHASGLPWDHEMKRAPQDSTALAAFVIDMARSVRLQFDPGGRFDGSTYSNAGYDLLGLIIERVSGECFERYVSEHVFNVVGMPDATYDEGTIALDDRTMPHEVIGNSGSVHRLNQFGMEDPDHPIRGHGTLMVQKAVRKEIGREHGPSGGTLTNVRDLSVWMAHLLRIHGDSSFIPPVAVLQHATLERMWTVQRDIPGKRTAIGIGWWSYRDPVLGRYVFHVGRDPGYCSVLLVLPDLGIGVVVLCNGMYADETVWNVIGPGIAKLVLQN